MTQPEAKVEAEAKTELEAKAQPQLALRDVSQAQQKAFGSLALGVLGGTLGATLLLFVVPLLPDLLLYDSSLGKTLPKDFRLHSIMTLLLLIVAYHTALEVYFRRVVARLREEEDELATGLGRMKDNNTIALIAAANFLLTFGIFWVMGQLSALMAFGGFLLTIVFQGVLVLTYVALLIKFVRNWLQARA